MSPRWPNGLILAALAVAGAASGQSSREGEGGEAESEILVTGRQAIDRREFERTVEAFVKDLGQPGPINRISRWGEPLCPSAMGLSEAFNAFVEERIRQVAIEAGAMAADDCDGRSNVLVIFTDRPHEFMADVRRNHPGLLGYHFVGQRASVATFEPPMKSWYVTKTASPGAYEAIDHAYGPTPPTGTGSLIRPAYQSRFAFVLIVVDAASVENREVGPIADKIAMLALSNPGERDGCSPLPSVLDLLDPACEVGQAVDGLTAYDQSYLKALYRFDGDELKGFMRETIAGKIVDDLLPLAKRDSER